MKKSLLWVFTISIIAIFTLVSCNQDEVIEEVVKGAEGVIADESVKESEPDIAIEIVELAKSQIGKLIGDGPFASIVWADFEYTYCDRFVSAVMTAASGESLFERKSYPTAYDDYIAHEGLIKFGEPPKGAVVYYGRHEENLNSGHVGISDGEGNVISVVNKTKGVDITPRNYFRAPLLGWITFKEYKSEEEIVKNTTAKGKIAFASNCDGNYEIYIMNTDGSGLTRLTDNPADDGGDGLFCFSPDGSKIAFASNRDGNYEIYIMNTDGSGLTRLTNNPEDDLSPCFSPDGSKIAFTSCQDNDSEEAWSSCEIYIMNIDGSERVRLTNNQAHDSVPSLSPDGSKIVFMSDRDNDLEEEWSWSRREIYIMNTDGSGLTRLTNNPEDDLSPCFSPDGSKIAFYSWRDRNYEIYIMNTDGSEQTRLTDNSAFDMNPVFSP